MKKKKKEIDKKNFFCHSDYSAKHMAKTEKIRFQCRCCRVSSLGFASLKTIFYRTYVVFTVWIHFSKSVRLSRNTSLLVRNRK